MNDPWLIATVIFLTLSAIVAATTFVTLILEIKPAREHLLDYFSDGSGVGDYFCGRMRKLANDLELVDIEDNQHYALLAKMTKQSQEITHMVIKQLSKEQCVNLYNALKHVRTLRQQEKERCANELVDSDIKTEANIAIKVMDIKDEIRDIESKWSDTKDPTEKHKYRRSIDLQNRYNQINKELKVLQME